MMRSKNVRMSGLLGILAFLFLFTCAPAYGDEELTIMVGRVDASGLFVTEKGEKYMLAPSEAREDLLKQDGKRVVVTGMVSGEGEQRKIAVTAYQLMGEKAGTDESDKSGE